MRISHEQLRAKGWSDSEIARTEDGLKRAEAQKHPAYAFLEVAVFWGLLFLSVVGIFTVSLVIVPLLLVLDNLSLALILALLGLCLGSLISLLLKDIEWATGRHHALALLLLATIGILNIRFIVNRMNALEAALSFGVDHIPWLQGAVFAVALVVPYLVKILLEQKVPG